MNGRDGVSSDAPVQPDKEGQDISEDISSPGNDAVKQSSSGEFKINE